MSPKLTTHQTNQSKPEQVQATPAEKISNARPPNSAASAGSLEPAAATSSSMSPAVQEALAAAVPSLDLLAEFASKTTEELCASAYAAAVEMTALEYQLAGWEEKVMCHELALKSAADRGQIPWSDPRIVRYDREREVDLEMRRITHR